MTTFRTLLIGAGGIGAQHARALDQSANLQLVGVVDPDSTRCSSLATRYGVPGCADLDEADTVAPYDVAIVAVPTFLHIAVAGAIARRGKDFLVEKPLHMLHEDAASLLRDVEDRGLVAMVGMTHRYYPEARRGKELIESGAIGEVLAIDDNIMASQGQANLSAWYLKGATSGGGSMFTDGIHAIDRIQWYAGSPIANVDSATARVLPHTGDVEAFCRANLCLANGVPATVMTNWTPAPILDCHVTIVGTRGVLVIDSWQGIRLHSSDGYEAASCYPPGMPSEERVVTGLRAEHAAFVSGLESRRSPVPLSDGVRDLKVLHQIYAKAGDGA
jgi:predicted dehydrogenase